MGTKETITSQSELEVKTRDQLLRARKCEIPSSLRAGAAGRTFFPPADLTQVEKRFARGLVLIISARPDSRPLSRYLPRFSWAMKRSCRRANNNGLLAG